MSEDPFWRRGDQLRKRHGIDGTAGDAQDVAHPFVLHPVTGACWLCGLNKGYRKHEEGQG